MQSWFYKSQYQYFKNMKEVIILEINATRVRLFASYCKARRSSFNVVFIEKLVLSRILCIFGTK